VREAGVVENRHVVLDVVWISSDPDTFQAVSDLMERGANVNLAAASDKTSILLGDGNGNFSQGPSYAINGTPFPILNSSGKTDLVFELNNNLTNTVDNKITRLTGNGDGTFQGIPTLPLSSTFPFPFAAADLNGDGLTDVLYVDSQNNLYGTNNTGGSRTGGLSVGTVFKLGPPRYGTHRTATLLTNFVNNNDDPGTNAYPNGAVTLYQGALYGTTAYGNSDGPAASCFNYVSDTSGCGSIFKVPLGAGAAKRDRKAGDSNGDSDGDATGEPGQGRQWRLSARRW